MRAKTKTDRKTKRITIRVSASLYASFAKRAAKDRRKLGDWARLVLEGALK